MAPQFDRLLLEKVADEMNDVMGLNPPFEYGMLEDGTLIDAIADEATGKGKLKDAIRADDFVTEDAEKKTFTEEVKKFFVTIGVWNARKEAVIMPAAAEEQAENDRLEAGESTGSRKAGKKTEVPRSVAEHDMPPGQDAQGNNITEKEDTTVSTKTKAAAKKGTAKKATKKGRSTATQKKAATKKGTDKEMSCFGHRAGSGGARIDEALNSGKDFKAIVKSVGVEESRLRGHVQHLKAEHGVHVTFDKSGKTSIKKKK